MGLTVESETIHAHLWLRYPIEPQRKRSYMKSDPAIIRNCLRQGDCDQLWGDMAPSDLQELTDTHETRQCKRCGNVVHLAATPEALCRFIERDFCVAIPWVISEDGQVVPRPEPCHSNPTDQDCESQKENKADVNRRSDRLVAAFIELGLEVSEVSSSMSLDEKYQALQDKGISEIKRRLELSHQGAKGYGEAGQAAKLAAKFFGIGWCLLRPKSTVDRSLRLSLRRAVEEAPPSAYSNNRMAWMRFQKNARKAHEKL